MYIHTNTHNYTLSNKNQPTITKNTQICLKSCDKEMLGLFSAQVRQYRVPEPYKGKGILYQNEIVRRKAGKSGKK